MDVKLGDQVQARVTVMFSDIRGFTTLSESMSPEDNFNFINGYLSRTGPIVGQNNGFISHYLGDGIMALFPDQAEDAITAAIKMHRQVAEYNQHRRSKKRVPIQIGVGLHTGLLRLGVIGDGERMDAGVISDTTNTASRMEGLTKIYGAPIVISEATRAGLDAAAPHHIRFLGKVQVKGKQDALSIYEVFDGDLPEIVTQKLVTKAIFEEGLQLYFQKDFAEAAVCFKNVLKDNKEDKAAGLYLKQSAHFMVNGAPEGWDGVEKLSQK